jgi:FAD:protein FMN transferase
MGLGGLAIALPSNSKSAKSSVLHWRERAMVGLGTTLSLRAGHASAERADAGLDAAVNAIRHVERHMSLFNPSSSLCQLNREGVLNQPDPDLVNILTLAKYVSARSQGSFDVTVQPLWVAWQNARQLNRIPTSDELKLARRKTGWKDLEISSQKIRFLRPGMALTLNGIAQGYASDLARDALRSQGIAHALIDTGEWSTLGSSPDSKPWTLGLASPRQADEMVAQLASDGRAIATSSDAHCSFSADLRHHHIFDPRTGYSPRELASVTVLAPTCAMADALTKVMFMSNSSGALALAKQWKVDVLVVDKAGRLHASSGINLSHRG